MGRTLVGSRWRTYLVELVEASNVLILHVVCACVSTLLRLEDCLLCGFSVCNVHWCGVFYRLWTPLAVE